MPNPPDSRAQRIRAMWKSRAAAAGLSVGAQTFCLSVLCALPKCLSSVWLCALPTVLLAPLLGLLCQRRLRARRLPGPFLSALLILPLMTGVVLLLCSLVILSGQALLPQARDMTILMLAAGALLFCALPGLMPCANAAFALRAALPVLLLLFGLRMAFPTRCAGLFPLLGTGLVPTLSACLYVFGGAAPALSLLTLPTEDEGGLRCLPPARFFAVRLALGALCAVLLLLLLSAGNPFEQLRSRALFADRLRLTGRSVSPSGVSSLLLVILQLTAFLLSAAFQLSCAVRRLAFVMRIRRPPALLILLFVCFSLVAALLRFGLDALFLAAPVVLTPSLLLVLLPGRESSCG